MRRQELGQETTGVGLAAAGARSRKTHTGRLLAEFLATHRGEKPEGSEGKAAQSKAAESKASESKANLAGLRPASRTRKESTARAGTKTRKTDSH